MSQSNKTTTIYPLTYTQYPGENYLSGATISLIQYYVPVKPREQILNDIFTEYEQAWKELADL